MSIKIIAEIGINWNGNFDLIPELIRQASLSGADFAKFQLYSSQSLFGDSSRAHNELTFGQLEKIKKFCEHYDIKLMISAFDKIRLGWCGLLDIDAYKVASRTVKHDPALASLVTSLAKKLEKDVYVSLGMHDNEALPFKLSGYTKFLNCISKYPTTFIDQAPLRDYVGNVIGLSDHSFGLGAPLYHIAQGADVIEKHFTLNKTMSGRDHLGSMTPDELKGLRTYGNEIQRARNAIKR